MRKILTGLNLVVILEQIAKPVFKSQNITSSLQEFEEPEIFWPLEPAAPGMINYPKMGINISLIENKVQIHMQILNGLNESQLPVICQKILNATDAISIKAYGFNFFYSVESEKTVKDMFNISLTTNEFTLIPNGTFVRLSFTKNNIFYLFELADGQPQSALHINAHHETLSKTVELAQNIIDIFNNDYRNASALINEVLGNG